MGVGFQGKAGIPYPKALERCQTKIIMAKHNQIQYHVFIGV